eukprot:5667882-Alexandrium_andersonii.AAC.1
MAPGHTKRRPSVGLEPGLALPRPEEARGAPGSLLVQLATDDVALQDAGRRPEAEGVDPPPHSADSNQ